MFGPLPTFFFNLLEFWTPVDCKPSGIVSTSLKKCRKNRFKEPTHFCAAKTFFWEGSSTRKSLKGENVTNSWSLIVNSHTRVYLTGHVPAADREALLRVLSNVRALYIMAYKGSDSKRTLIFPPSPRCPQHAEGSCIIPSSPRYHQCRSRLCQL